MRDRIPAAQVGGGRILELLAGPLCSSMSRSLGLYRPGSGCVGALGDPVTIQHAGTNQEGAVVCGLQMYILSRPDRQLACKQNML